MIPADPNLRFQLTTKQSKTMADNQEMLLIGSKTKEALKANNVNVAGTALEGLNSVVHWYIQQAAARAKANGRKTVRADDFIVGCE